MSSVSRWRDSGPWNVPSRPPTASRPSTPPSPRCWTTPAAASRRDAQAARHDPGTAGRPELYLFRSLVKAVPGPCPLHVSHQAEYDTWQGLLSDRWGRRLRLEQERIPLSVGFQALKNAANQ
jgi:hypothetical protein